VSPTAKSVMLGSTSRRPAQRQVISASNVSPAVGVLRRLVVVRAAARGPLAPRALRRAKLAPIAPIRSKRQPTVPFAKKADFQRSEEVGHALSAARDTSSALTNPMVAFAALRANISLEPAAAAACGARRAPTLVGRAHRRAPIAASDTSLIRLEARRVRSVPRASTLSRGQRHRVRRARAASGAPQLPRHARSVRRAGMHVLQRQTARSALVATFWTGAAVLHRVHLVLRKASIAPPSASLCAGFQFPQATTASPAPHLPKTK
jgi:hypothetical protein